MRWLGSSAAGVGVLGGLMAFAPGIALPLVVSVPVLLVCVAGAGSYSWFSTRPVHLPVEALAPSAFSTRPSVTLEIVRDRGVLYAVNELARESYPGVQPMSPERYEQYLLVNPNILCAALGPDRSVLGYFDIFPMTESFGRALLQGVVGEQDLRHENLLPEARAGDASLLYLGGIAVKEPETFPGQRAASQLVWGMFQYLSFFYPPHMPRQLVASAATREGAALLARFQFQMVLPASLAKDGCALYALSMDSPALKVAESGLPDWRSSCNLSWLERDEVETSVGSIA